MAFFSLFNDSLAGSGNATASERCSFGENITHISMISLLILLGVPGNCLIVRVYWAKRRKTSTHVFIMGLAWADLFACLFLIHAILSNCLFGTGDESATLKILRYFLLSAMAVSVHMTSLIAFDRYECVCRPKRRLLNHRRAVTSAVTATAHSLAISSIYLLVLVYPKSIVAPIVLCAVQIVFYAIAMALIIVCYGKVYQTIRSHVKLGIGNERISNWPNRSALKRTKLAFVETEYDDTVKPTALLAAAVKPNTDISEVQSVSDNTEHKLTDDTSSTSQDNVKRSGFTKLERPKSAGGGADSGAHSSVRDKPLPASNPKNKVLQRNTTRMLLVTSVVFLLSWVPYWIFIATLLARLHGAQISDEVSLAFERFAYTKYLNSAVNPLIYSLANRRFRKDCQDVFERYKCW